jgi:O-Antigen ligase
MTTASTIHPFETSTGSARIARPAIALVLLAVIGVAGMAAARMGVMGAGIFIPVIGAIVYGYFLFTYPSVGLYTAVALSFVLIGIGRYAKGLQVGLGMDAILILTYIALFINRFKEKLNWAPANKDITYLSFIWFAYSIFEIVNPEARSFAAWFSGRGISVYMFLLAPLTLLFINSNRKLDIFLYVWGTFSILATLKGIMQLKFGVDFAEREWLNEGNYKTHILFGQLRVFSFLSDAGQFGANQAYSAVVAIIYAMAQTGKKSKLFFYTVGFLGLYGMLISGTRGSMSVPLAGFMVFFVLRKNVKVLSIGIGLIALVFIFFKFTLIGQGNEQIRRMRTAFDPNDASLQVRLNNQKLLKNYLASRPFGGGIGHGGVKAQKFLPNAFLSQVATDSWYVLIWVEQGIIGLLLHLSILFYVLIKSCYKIMFRIRSPQLKLQMSALTAGMAGVMVASYGNAVLGTMPTGTLIYISMAILMNSDYLDSKYEPIPEPVKNN